ncbi:MAG: ferrous iron transport protein A [Clostridiales bacterium]|jgi:ferrous iron transport protein A|nr:ferrous iron transport protein A [Clostridiales bacterium]
MREISLTKIPIGERAIVRELLTIGSTRRRLQDIGLIVGTEVECLYKSPPGDPTAYLIRGAVIALRIEDAEQIMVESCEAHAV